MVHRSNARLSARAARWRYLTLLPVLIACAAGAQEEPVVQSKQIVVKPEDEGPSRR